MDFEHIQNVRMPPERISRFMQDYVLQADSNAPDNGTKKLLCLFTTSRRYERWISPPARKRTLLLQRDGFTWVFSGPASAETETPGHAEKQP